MSAVTLLNELRTAGVVVTATPDGNLELDAPKGLLTKSKVSELRQHKAEIVSLLSGRCPFCARYVMRQEQYMKEDLLYIDTVCGACGELVECFVPA